MRESRYVVLTFVATATDETQQRDDDKYDDESSQSYNYQEPPFIVKWSGRRLIHCKRKQPD